MDSNGRPAPPPPNRRTLSPGRRRLFVALILIVLAGVQELVCRWLFPLPECASFNRINYTPVEFYGDDTFEVRHLGLGNAKLFMESEPDGFAFDHTLNLYGFRSAHFALRPDAGRPRVAFIGDSFAEGAGAADDDTIAVQFARILQTRRPVEAINLGITGTGFSHHAQLARDILPLLKPRDLFLIVCFNDIPTQPFSEFADQHTPAPDFPRLNPWMPRAMALIGRWWAGEVIPSRFPSGPYHIHAPVPSRANPLSNLAAPPENIDPDIFSSMQRGRTNPYNLMMAAGHVKAMTWDYAKGNGAREYIAHIASDCKRHECRLIVVYIPHPVNTNPLYMQAQIKMGADYGKVTRLDGPDFRTAQRHLREATRSLGIPFLDSTDELIEAEKAGERMFWMVDGHCTAAGYRLVADLCAKYWSEGALPRGADSWSAGR